MRPLDLPYYRTVPYRKAIPPLAEGCHLFVAKILAKLEGKWLLTYNGHPRIWAMYKGFRPGAGNELGTNSIVFQFVP